VGGLKGFGNLFILEAGRAYMIQSEGDAVWEVTGRPRLVRQKWKPNEYNFVGFHVDETHPPTASDWFSGSSAHSPLGIWRLSEEQVWKRVLTPSTETLKRGEAYWVFCDGQSDFQGPVEIDLTQGVEINYSFSLVEHVLSLKVPLSQVKGLSVRMLPSLAPPTGSSFSPVAGNVPLTWYGKTVQGATTTYGFKDLPASVEFTVEDQVGKELRLAVDRTRMAPAPGGSAPRSYPDCRDRCPTLRRRQYFANFRPVIAWRHLLAGGKTP